MNYFISLKQNKKILILVTVVMVLLGLILSFLHPLEYSATTKLLVIVPADGSVDSYNVIKGVEEISSKLSQIVYTTSFFDKVLNSGFNIDKTYFKADELKQRKQWSKMVATQEIRGSGMLKIVVYHESKAQAEEISKAISYVLNSSAWEYVGNKSIQLKEVDRPLLSKWPAKPNFTLNVFLALVLSLVVNGMYVYLSAYQSEVAKLAPQPLKNKQKKEAPVLNKKNLVNKKLTSKEEVLVKEDNLPEITPQEDDKFVAAPLLNRAPELEFELAAVDDGGEADLAEEAENLKILTMHDHLGGKK